MTDKLKPCPFCGGDAHWGVPCDTLVIIACSSDKCGWELALDSEEEALRCWNTRPAEDALRDEIERLRAKRGYDQ